MAFFSNVLSIGPPLSAYDEYRPIFKKYVAATQLADQLGWNPVTDASPDKKTLILERYGSLGEKKCLFTMINTAKEQVENFRVVVHARKIGFKRRLTDLVAFDLIKKSLLPINPVAGGDEVSFSIMLDANEAAAVLVGERKDILRLLGSTQIDQAVLRVRNALKVLPLTMKDNIVNIPSQWNRLVLKADQVLLGLSGLARSRHNSGLLQQLKEVITIAQEMAPAMGSTRRSFEVEVVSVFSDVSRLLNGWYGHPHQNETGGNF